MERKTVEFDGEELELVYPTYRNGGTAIQLFQEGEPYMTATAWVPGLEEGEVAIKDYSENSGIYECLVENDIITPAHRSVFSGYVILPVCYLKEAQ